MSHNIEDRYHISDGESLLEATRRRHEAWRIAQLHANRDGHPYTVFDSMARRGQGDLWTFHPGADPNGLRAIPPTRRRKA